VAAAARQVGEGPLGGSAVGLMTPAAVLLGCASRLHHAQLVAPHR
jgi:hypothetical protein